MFTLPLVRSPFPYTTLFRSLPSSQISALFEDRARNPSCVTPLPIQRLPARSEEHTSELQSLRHLVCRLLLEKTKLGQFSGRVQQTYKHYVPRFFFPEHGTMF